MLMKNQSTMSFSEIKKLWNSQPFLERLIFLMNKLKMSEENAERIAKLQFEKINDNYKVKIYQVLN